MTVEELPLEGVDGSTRVVLARHGQTPYNVDHRYRGRDDPPLDTTGARQAELLGKAVATLGPSAIYASPRRRARSTAAAIARATGLVVAVDEGLDDIDYGRWTGKTPDEVRVQYPTDWAEWQSAPQSLHLPGGESVWETQTRLWNALLAIHERHPRDTVVAVTHDIAIRLLVCRVLGAPLEAMHVIRVDTASTSAIEVGASKPRLAWLNATGHLREPGVR